MVSLINDIKGSNLEDNEFIFKCPIIGRCWFRSFNPVSTDNGSFSSELDTFPKDSVKVVSLKLMSGNKGMNGSARGFRIAGFKTNPFSMGMESKSGGDEGNELSSVTHSGGEHSQIGSLTGVEIAGAFKKRSLSSCSILPFS